MTLPKDQSWFWTKKRQQSEQEMYDKLASDGIGNSYTENDLLKALNAAVKRLKTTILIGDFDTSVTI